MMQKPTFAAIVTGLDLTPTITEGRFLHTFVTQKASSSRCCFLLLVCHTIKKEKLAPILSVFSQRHYGETVPLLILLLQYTSKTLQQNSSTRRERTTEALRNIHLQISRLKNKGYNEVKVEQTKQEHIRIFKTLNFEKLENTKNIPSTKN